jgi:hypothetical protein
MPKSKFDTSFPFGANVVAKKAATGGKKKGSRRRLFVVNDLGLHDWHAAWIDNKVREHEIDQG